MGGVGRGERKRWSRKEREEEGHALRADGDGRSPSSETHPVAFQSLRAVLLLLLEAAAALAPVEYVRRELPALGAGAADARRATRHRDTCELTTTAEQHRPFLVLPPGTAPVVHDFSTSSIPSSIPISSRSPFRGRRPSRGTLFLQGNDVVTPGKRFFFRSRVHGTVDYSKLSLRRTNARTDYEPRSRSRQVSLRGIASIESRPFTRERPSRLVDDRIGPPRGTRSLTSTALINLLIRRGSVTYRTDRTNFVSRATVSVYTSEYVRRNRG